MAMDSRRTYGQLAVETMTDGWWGKTREGRQMDRQTDGLSGIDGQPAVETARDSQWTLRKNKSGQTDG